MAKGYVIIDIPESCNECQLCAFVDGLAEFICRGMINDDSLNNFFGYTVLPEDVVLNDLKPDWCPIKEPPEFEVQLGTYQENWLYVEGYSACFKDIFGDYFDYLDEDFDSVDDE